MLVDCHAHLHFHQFDADRDQLLSQIEELKIFVINTGTDHESNIKSLDLAKKHSFIKASLGIHPVDIVNLAESQVQEEIDFISSQNSSIISIGEVGLDFHHIQDQELREKQKNMLKMMIEQLSSLKKPFVFHSRSAEQELLKLITTTSAKKVVFHCYTGPFKLAKEIEQQGYYFSIPSNIQRSLHFQGLVSQTSITQLLTETDCPFLAPPPKVRSDPTMVKYTIDKISELKELTTEDTEKNIFMNAQKVFGNLQ